jgi:hypothetical protein
MVEALQMLERGKQKERNTPFLKGSETDRGSSRQLLSH